jgi:hypothetical protein
MEAKRIARFKQKTDGVFAIGLEYLMSNYWMEGIQMRAIAFIVLLTTTLNCHAEEVLVGYGVGAQGCGKYIEQRRTPNHYYDALITSWFYGLASGHNIYSTSSQIKQEIDAETVLAYLDKQCRDFPLSSISVGADKLIKTYQKK